MTLASGKRVVILGGGVAGMSAAHELVERGFEVEVLERKPIPGGKARSLAVTAESLGRPSFLPARAAGSWPAGRAPLPGEHGFRFFPGFYRHIIDTMARIPYRAGYVADNLTDTHEAQIAPFDLPAYSVPARFPAGPTELREAISAVVTIVSGQAGVPPGDGAFFASKLWEFLTSCEERRLVEYERVNWWDFIEAEGRSAAYQRYFGNAITRSLVAAKARRASAKTIGDIFCQLLFEILLPDVPADRVLNGPTNDVWIDPWLNYLRDRGVAYRTDVEVRAINCGGGVIRSVSAETAGGPREITGDYFIGALPVERMAELVSPDLLRADGSLASLLALTEYVEWMNGIQFYLTEDVPLARGHVICIDSPWALTVISQPQFWDGFQLAERGDGAIKGLLSVDISDWDVKGLNGKEAQRCTRDEIAAEAWQQLKRSVNGGSELLYDAHLHSWFVDPDIENLAGGGGGETNAEPLLVNYVDTWRIRPEAETRIPNFFLASDYVRTYTDLATMEGANEAARRAVNGILRRSRVAAAPCQIWNLHEPEALVPFRAYDRVRYRQGLGWDREVAGLARTMLDAFGNSGGQPPPGQPGPPAEGDPAAVAAEARSSSDGGLRRLRIRRAS